MRTNTLLVIAFMLIGAPAARSQKGIEITPFAGWQTNGGIDLSTATFNHIDVENGLNYGISGVYLLGDYTGVEFMWNHNKANTLLQFNTGGTAPRVLQLTTNQYLGDFVIHFTNREHKFRPFVLLGLGVSNLAPDRSDAGSITRFSWAFGGGAKYYLSKHIGVRIQLKTSPTYISSGSSAFWCDPFWGGCWNLGQSTFLQELDVSGGVTFRF